MTPHHIAVIDDDESVRDAMAGLLSVLGYSVDSFSSAEAFLHSPDTRDVACVIADVQMPGMSGIDLQRHLSLGSQSVPIIFVTAYPDETTRERAIRNGAIGYLTKPLHEESLLKCLDEALGA